MASRLGEVLTPEERPKMTDGWESPQSGNRTQPIQVAMVFLM